MGTFGISVPKATLWSPQAALGLLQAILSDKIFQNQMFTLGVHARFRENHFYVSLPSDEVTLLEFSSLVNAFYPLAEVYPLGNPTPSYPSFRRLMFFRGLLHIRLNFLLLFRTSPNLIHWHRLRR